MIADFLHDHVVINNKMTATQRRQQRELNAGQTLRKLKAYRGPLENAQPQAVLLSESTMTPYPWLDVGRLSSATWISWLESTG